MRAPFQSPGQPAVSHPTELLQQLASDLQLVPINRFAPSLPVCRLILIRSSTCTEMLPYETAIPADLSFFSKCFEHSSPILQRRLISNQVLHKCVTNPSSYHCEKKDCYVSSSRKGMINKLSFQINILSQLHSIFKTETPMQPPAHNHITRTPSTNSHELEHATKAKYPTFLLSL